MLDVATCLTLKPWFTAETLRRAEGIIDEDDCRLIYYRDASALVFSERSGHCLVRFSSAPHIPQKFRPCTVECSLCHGLQKIGEYCAHAAVVAILVLQEKELAMFAGPLLFSGSSMMKVSEFLNDLNTPSPEIIYDGENPASFIFKTRKFSLRVALASGDQELLVALFPVYKFPEICKSSKLNNGEIAGAMKHLINQCSSATEKALNEVGQVSLGQERAKSLWTQLCYQIFMGHPEVDCHVRRDSQGVFSLVFGSENDPCFVLFPENQYVIRCLKQTANIGLVTMTDPVRAYTKIYFDKDDSLLLEPWLEFGNGERRRRIDTQNFIYGEYCSLESNLFAHIEEQEDDFRPKTNNMPLLAFAEKSDPASLLRIPSHDVPAFLDRNLTAILSGRHDPDPALKEFRIAELPDCIEVLDYNEDDDWCYLSARYACGSRHLDLQEILALRRAGKDHAAGKGVWLQVKNTPLDWLYNLGEDQAKVVDEDGTLRLTKLEMMALTALIPELQLPEESSRRQVIQSRLANLKFCELAEADIPSHLRPYQGAGLTWLAHLYQNGIGAILADEMGLGKTHQALALLEIVMKRNGGPALVVCPASVLPHWQDKIASFYPNLHCLTHYGPNRQLAPSETSQLLLTTYGVMRQDAALLAEYKFGVIIFDEIQYLKNKKNATSKAAACLSSHVNFGLSGTPLENSLTDLKSIYDLCVPGLFGTNSEFQRTYVMSIEENGDQGRLDILRRLVGPFMLRREKSKVLTELPDVIDDVRYCYLSPDQQTLYQQAIDHEGQELLSAVKDSAKPFPHLSFLALVQQLKQICNHPSQLLKSESYEKYRSGKWDLFKEILQECLDAGLKVVVFSQYTSMLNIIERYLQDQEIRYGGLRGGTAMAKRQQQVKSFNNDQEIRVFCASLLAGGTGIDLTGAQAVIHYDRWWNSAKEEQATARVHRFGQKHAVQVFKFVTTGTLEEKIHRLITKKQNLAADAIQNDDGSIIKKLSKDEISSILQWSPS